MEFFIGLAWLAGIAIGLVIFYYIIRAAVKDGYKMAVKEIEEKESVIK